MSLSFGVGHSASEYDIMSNEIATKRDGEPVEARTEGAYKAPELFEVGSSKKLIRGPMIDPYYDCISGRTLTRPSSC